jgi:hypothetical protein
MKRIYVVVGELEDTDQIDSFDGAYTTIDRADERCTELEAENNGHIWYWREVVLEEEGD